ncbi:MAG: hypothetical protein JWM11_6841 [Planctomycetaceae bacterium]|nr:hypothetical protein [Planctomycetaceae bacterium]
MLFPPSRFGAARVCLQTLANVQRAGGDRIRVRIRFQTLWSVGPRHASSTLARVPPWRPGDRLIYIALFGGIMEVDLKFSISGRPRP